MGAAEYECARLEKEVARLTTALEKATTTAPTSSPSGPDAQLKDTASVAQRENVAAAASRHTLLLLADSALPLGAFAFSSGLESYIAHHRPRPAFPPFLALSIASLASTALPYVLAAYRSPSTLAVLDNDFDASTPCTVARRASIAQGRALLGVWERALRSPTSLPSFVERGDSKTSTMGEAIGNGEAASLCPSEGNRTISESVSAQETASSAAEALTVFSYALKSAPAPGSSASQQQQQPHQARARVTASFQPQINGHMAPLWGAICRSQGLSQDEAAHVFLLNHAKAVVSAAVRASVLGPYAAQAMLASGWLRGVVADALAANWETAVEEAGQCVPLLDLWVGRHELLYSRIFNS